LKRADLVRYLAAHDVEHYREGGRHSVYIRRRDHKTIAIPRHNEINVNVVRSICRELGIEPPAER